MVGHKKAVGLQRCNGSNFYRSSTHFKHLAGQEFAIIPFDNGSLLLVPTFLKEMYCNTPMVQNNIVSFIEDATAVFSECDGEFYLKLSQNQFLDSFCLPELFLYLCYSEAGSLPFLVLTANDVLSLSISVGIGIIYDFLYLASSLTSDQITALRSISGEEKYTDTQQLQIDISNQLINCASCSNE